MINRDSYANLIWHIHKLMNFEFTGIIDNYFINKYFVLKRQELDL